MSNRKVIITITTLLLLFTVSLIHAKPSILYQKVRQVFALETDEYVGSAVLLKIDSLPQKTGQKQQVQRIGYFATCYHILHQCAKIKLQASDVAIEKDGRIKWSDYRRQIWYTQDDLQMRVYARPEYDLAILQVVMPDDWLPEVMNLPSPQVIKSNLHNRGVALGFPGYDRIVYPVFIRIGAKSDKASDYPWLWNKNCRPQMQFYFINAESTAPGMSGGGVWNREGQFVGIIFGAMPSYSVGLAIHNQDVINIFEQALDQDRLQSFASARSQGMFNQPPVFSTNINTQKNKQYHRVDKLEWNQFQKWPDYLVDLSNFREDLQEIRLDLPRDSKDIYLSLDKDMRDETNTEKCLGNGTIYIYVNGKMVTEFSRKKGLEG